MLTATRTIPTGFADLDRLMYGLRGSTLTAIAGQPGSGTTTLAIDFARNAAMRCGARTLFVSLDQPAAAVTNRILSAESSVPHVVVDRGTADAAQQARLRATCDALAPAPFLLNGEYSRIDVVDLAALARRIHRQTALGAVMVDGLRGLTADHSPEDGRDVEVNAIIRALRRLAKDLDVPVVLTTHLHRPEAERFGGLPDLADLRECEGVEQDADVVIMLHREDAARPESPRAGEADLIVAKHRNGPRGTVTVAAQFQYSRFVDMASEGGSR